MSDLISYIKLPLTASIKILPHGVPELIFLNSSSYSALDFKVCAPSFHHDIHLCPTYKQVTIDYTIIDTVHGPYINTVHPVFNLIPQLLGNFLKGCYDHLGHPSLECGSIWSVYHNILSAVWR